MLNTYTLWQPIHRVFILQNCNSLPIKKLTPYFPLFPASGQLSFCLCSFGILQGSHISEIIQYLCFCNCLLLCIISLSSSHVLECPSSLWLNGIPLYVSTAFVYPFICLRTLGFLPAFGCCE